MKPSHLLLLSLAYTNRFSSFSHPSVGVFYIPASPSCGIGVHEIREGYKQEQGEKGTSETNGRGGEVEGEDRSVKQRYTLSPSYPTPARQQIFKRSNLQSNVERNTLTQWILQSVQHIIAIDTSKRCRAVAAHAQVTHCI